MRTHRWISAFCLAAALSLAACDSDAGSDLQDGNEDARAPGYAPEEGTATAANDTTPYRPGTP